MLPTTRLVWLAGIAALFGLVAGYVDALRAPVFAIDAVLLLAALVDAWLRSRKSGKVRWRFRADDARIKLHRLYPSLP